MTHALAQRLRQALVLATLHSVAAAVPASASQDHPTNEVVVTATRSGIPVWWVDGPVGTLVVVGTIKDLAPGTRWESDKIVNAMQKADRVVMSGVTRHRLSLVEALRLQSQAKRVATLPRGYDISAYVTEHDMQRLKRLLHLGVLERGFERKHPAQLAQELIQSSKGERASRGLISLRRLRLEDDPESLIKVMAKKHRISIVNPAQSTTKPALRNLLKASPTEHLPCLRDALTLAERGTGAFEARSSAWASAKVGEVLASQFEKTASTCLPLGLRGAGAEEIAIKARGYLLQPGTTLLVADLSELAGPAGVLGHYSAQGLRVRGPRWH
jgi:uncharacterized protein YbaP (TraB family)